jgi:pilus assembly protein CpaE
MNPAQFGSATEPAISARFLCASADPLHAQWLARALASAGAVESAPMESAALVTRIAECAPSAVFIDFTVHADQASALAHAARDAFPAVPLVALGTLASSQSSYSAVAALRAGVRDFVDVTGNAADVLAVVKRLSDERPEPVSRHGKITVLLGARVGMGVSTLAANLAVSLQKRGASTDKAAAKTTALLDLGLPAADSALMLDTRSELHFVDAVRNLRRFDETFVNSAFARHASGLALTTLPADLAAMRAISFASAVNTLNRLRVYFDHQIVDLGGFSNLEFVAQVVAAADTVWLLCDANVTSAVSAMALIETLRSHTPDQADSPGPKPGLVVTKFDAALNFGANQLAARLDLPLVAVLPERAQALGRAVNQGRLLSEIAERDPYVRALAPLVAKLAGTTGADAHRTPERKPLPHFLPTFLKRS